MRFAIPCMMNVPLAEKDSGWQAKSLRSRIQAKCPWSPPSFSDEKARPGSSDPPTVYSERSAMIGSTRVARRAGRYPASAAIAESRAMAMAMVAGS
jgi:hypothetical protein